MFRSLRPKTAPEITLSINGHDIIATAGQCLAVGLWLTSWALDFWKYSQRVWRESPTLYLPTFYVDAALFIGMVLMMVFTAWHLILHIRALFTPVSAKKEA